VAANTAKPSLAPLEADGNWIRVEQARTHRFELHAAVQIESFVGVEVRRHVEAGQQALDVDVEAHRAVRRRAGVRQIRTGALDDDALQQVRECPGGEGEGRWIGGRNAIEHGAVGFEASVGDGVERDRLYHLHGGIVEERHAPFLAVVAALLLIDRASVSHELRQELSDVDPVTAGIAGDGNSARLAAADRDGLRHHVGAGVDD
jgi:hypothetical protein